MKKQRKLIFLLCILALALLLGRGLLFGGEVPAGPAETGGLELSLATETPWEAELPTAPEETEAAEPLSEAETPIAEEPAAEPEATEEPEELTLDEDGSYTTKEDVALYIHLYGHLPSNFITKREAEALGWPGGSLEPYAPGMCIGGGRFGNYEGNLPTKKGRSYTECDIDTLGARSRGPKRIVFSNDGLIYYTGDHYETFELLYGEP